LSSFQHLAGSKWDLDETQLLGDFENRKILTGQILRSGYQKEKESNSEWHKSRFARVERERRHSTNKYLLSAYYVTGTVLHAPKKKKKKKKTGSRNIF
jgi:hypothetical protein